MKTKIEYAGTCFQGLVRQNNEDNFWCNRRFLPCVNTGTDEIFKGTLYTQDSPTFAIFDGMGGEAFGEVASYLAAEDFDSQQKQWRSVPETEADTFIQNLCQDLSDKVYAYARENRTGTMGSTAVILLFHDRSVFAVNVGDSRIYRLYDHKLKQLSEDHVSRSSLYRHPPLTQYLGLPQEEMMISPHMQKINCGKDMILLMCSDGLTDMFTDQELEEILNQNDSVEKTVSYLQEETLRRGAWDNTTIILCKIIVEKKVEADKR